jgi:hypothetical protein
MSNSTDRFLTASHRRITLTIAQPLGSHSPVLDHRHIELNRSLSHCVSQENHLEYHIISTLCIEETSTSFHLNLRENDTPNSWASSHRGTQHSISVLERNHTPCSWASLHRDNRHSISVSEKNHTPNSGASSPHTGAQRSIFVSERNHTPISWAHPTHGLPHPTQGHTMFLIHLREEPHAQLMGFLSCRLTQSMSWRMCHVAVIINTPSQLGRHSPSGQVSYESTRTMMFITILWI